MRVTIHLRSGKTYTGVIETRMSPYDWPVLELLVDGTRQAYYFPWTSIEWVRDDGPRREFPPYIET